MRRLIVHASKSYEVLIGTDILKNLGQYVFNTLPPGKLCLVTDSNVDPLYSASASASLETSGYELCKYVFPPGENSKNIKVLNDILEFMGKNQLTRSDGLVALGGGVTGDMAGFAAATYLRGIPFVQAPTTLLAAVDSSVGGKTGVNSSAGKNLIGAFWQPSLVVCDCKAFETLPKTTYLDGIAEAIKYGVIADKALFSSLAAGTISEEQLVERCISIKSNLVSQDERDEGIRQLLNFGHTSGHAIEKCSDYTISHGHAVAIGMLIASKAAASMKLVSSDSTPAIKELLLKYGFSLSCPFSPLQLTEAALNDKKRQGQTITLVIPDSLGDCRLAKLDINLLKEFFTLGLKY